MKKKALVFGSTGQDGSYMLELLIKKNYQVHGIIRRSATGNTKNINHLINNKKIYNKSLFLHKGDLLDVSSIASVIKKVKPSEFYNFADQDHISWSFEIPAYSFNVTANSVIQILEVIKNTNNKIKYFQPISSNIFGLTKTNSQNELTEKDPNSIYSIGKISAYHSCRMYDRIFNIFACGAIFYNHESPRRSSEYVTKKIVENVCKIYHKKEKYLYLGDTSSKIDWGYAKDYVEAAWQIMQLKKPDFFVIATGETHSVDYFAKKCFSYVGLDYRKYLKTDKKLMRLIKNSTLKGNISKAKRTFKYKVKTKLDDLIKIMMDHELKKYNG